MVENVLPTECPFCGKESIVLSVKSFGKAGSITTIYNCKCSKEDHFYQVIISPEQDE